MGSNPFQFISSSPFIYPLLYLSSFHSISIMMILNSISLFFPFSFLPFSFFRSDFHWNSFSTMVSVTSVAFILAVLLTALAFICCKRYWKERDDRNLEYHETTFYRMACSASEAPLVTNSTPYSFSSDTSGRLNHHHDILNSYRARTQHVISTSTSSGHLDMNGISVIELPGYPPPPYRSRTSINLDPETDHLNQMNHSNTLQTVTAGDPTLNHSEDGVRPSSAIVVRKPFWRKLSQWVVMAKKDKNYDSRINTFSSFSVFKSSL